MSYGASSETYLEDALEEYNQKISNITDPMEMLDALVGRGSVLMLMESYVSAASDLEDAADLLNELRSAGRKIDAGIFIKVHTDLGNMGLPDEALEHYRNAMGRLPDLNERSRYFDSRKIVDMCLTTAYELMDMDQGKDAVVFIEKAKDSLTDDAWSRNRLSEMYSMLGQIHQYWNKYESIDMFDRSIGIAESLLSEDLLENKDEMALAYMYIGDIYEEMGSLEDSVRHHQRAAEIMEMMLNDGDNSVPDTLSQIYKGIAENLFKLGRSEEGEMMLIRSMRHQG